MCRLIESLCCLNGQLLGLAYHQRRIDRAFQALFGDSVALQIATSISVPSELVGLYKCRIVYDAKSYSYTFEAYERPQIESLELVTVDDLVYSHKYEDRRELDRIFLQKNQADDIIIIKNELVTDSYYANLAFYNGHDWLTPERPLLAGTRRQYLLDTGQIRLHPLKATDIFQFEKVSLINAMLDLGDLVLPVSHILHPV